MKFLKALLITAGLSVSATSWAAEVKLTPVLISALKPFNPISANVDTGMMTVELNQPAITQANFISVISAICAATKNETDWGAGGEAVEDVLIASKNLAQGWMFEGGIKECQQLAKLPDDKATSFILSISRPGS